MDIGAIKGSTRVLNVGLHGFTLATRFLFVFFLAKYLDPAAMGYYGLFTATIGYGLYFVGLDFYTYSTREMVKAPMVERGRLLKGQAALSGVLYLIFSPISLVMLIVYSGWPTHLVGWFIPILLLEHFNQEMSRLFIALSEQIVSSVLLFLRQGSWALVIVVLMNLNKESRSLAMVLLLWGMAGLVAAIFAMYRLRRLGLGGWKESLDWAWIKKGVAVSISFLVATLALRGFQTIDRYCLVAIGGLEVVGAYTIFTGVTGSLLTFLDAGVFSFAYPVFIKLYQNREFDLAHLKIRQILLITILMSLGFSVVSWIVLPYLLEWIGKELYLKNINLFPWLLVSTIINAIQLVPHYALYASGMDRPIVFSHIAAFLVFVLTVWIFSAHFGLMAVPYGLILAFLFVLLCKSFFYWRRLAVLAGPS